MRNSSSIKEKTSVSSFNYLVSVYEKSNRISRSSNTYVYKN